MAEQHVHWQEQGRHAPNFRQAGFERAAQEHVQAAREEVHVAVAKTTYMSRAEMRGIVGALENQAVQAWTPHQVPLLNEMNSVGDANENQRRSLLTEAMAELQMPPRDFVMSWFVVEFCSVDSGEVRDGMSGPRAARSC